MKRFGFFIVLPLIFFLGVFFRLSPFSFSNREVNSHEEESETVQAEPVFVNASSPAPKPTLSDHYCKNAHTTTCRADFPTVDPTGKVISDVSGEVLALRHLRNIIRKNPTWTSEQIEDQLALRIYTPERTRQLEETFQWVLHEISELIKDQSEAVFSLSEKARVLERLEKIELELPPPARVYFDAADLLTKNTIYYERTSQGRLRLRVGGAYLLNATSWFNLVFSFAHEIAHAIDPCEMKQADVSPEIYSSLIECFVQSGWVSRNRIQCEKGEQVSEVFADWLASEIAGKALRHRADSYSPSNKVRAAINFSRDLCEQSSGTDILNVYAHGSPALRIGEIIGKNPSLRKELGCPWVVSDSYCRFGSLDKSGLKVRQ